MREMKESHAPWLGDVPANWGVDKLKYHLTRTETRNPGDKTVLSLYRELGVIPKDSREDNHNVTSEDTSNYKYVRPGDFVINKMKAWQGSVAVSDYEGIVSPAYFVYHFTDNCFNKRYFHYLLRSSYKEEFRRLSGGIRVGQWDLPSSSLDNVLVLLPKISDQIKIADFLDTKCAEIDALAADIQTQIDTLEQYKRSVITEAVTKGLNPDVKMRPCQTAGISLIPDNWETSRFKYIATIMSNLVNPEGYEEYPQISPDNIEKNSGRLLSYTTVEEAGVISGNHLFFAGQILYSKIRPNLNKVTIAPFDGLCSADMYPIETNQDKRFILYMMLSNYFVEQVTLVIQDRVKMPRINQEELGCIKIILPPITEQRVIADFLDAQCAEIDTLITNKKAQLANLADYKKSLIFEYVTGKKEVPAS